MVSFAQSDQTLFSALNLALTSEPLSATVPSAFSLELHLEHVARNTPKLAPLGLLLPVNGISTGVLDLEGVHSLANNDQTVERSAKVVLRECGQLLKRTRSDGLG